MPGSEKQILKAVADLGRAPSDVKLILLTHRHWDNIGSAAALKKATSGMLVSHGFEKPYVAGTLVVITPRAWSLYGRIARRALAIASSTKKLLRLVKYHPVLVDEASDEESILERVGLDGSIVWTPGHTKGSVSLFLNESRVAIIGDLLRTKRGKLREPLFMEISHRKGRVFSESLICIRSSSAPAVASPCPLRKSGSKRELPHQSRSRLRESRILILKVWRRICQRKLPRSGNPRGIRLSLQKRYGKKRVGG